MTELKPCPFCGGPVAFHQDEACDGCHYIQCTKCDCFVDFSSVADPANVAETIQGLRALIVPKWNTRVGEPDA